MFPSCVTFIVVVSFSFFCTYTFFSFSPCYVFFLVFLSWRYSTCLFFLSSTIFSVSSSFSSFLLFLFCLNFLKHFLHSCTTLPPLSSPPHIQFSSPSIFVSFSFPSFFPFPFLSFPYLYFSYYCIHHIFCFSFFSNLFSSSSSSCFLFHPFVFFLENILPISSAPLLPFFHLLLWLTSLFPSPIFISLYPSFISFIPYPLPPLYCPCFLLFCIPLSPSLLFSFFTSFYHYLVVLFPPPSLPSFISPSLPNGGVVSLPSVRPTTSSSAACSRFVPQFGHWLPWIQPLQTGNGKRRSRLQTASPPGRQRLPHWCQSLLKPRLPPGKSGTLLARAWFTFSA